MHKHVSGVCYVYNHGTDQIHVEREGVRGVRINAFRESRIMVHEKIH